MEGYISIIVAVLSFLGTLIGSYFANRKSTALMIYRIEQLEKRVDELTDKIEKIRGDIYEKERNDK